MTEVKICRGVVRNNKSVQEAVWIQEITVKSINYILEQQQMGRHGEIPFTIVVKSVKYPGINLIKISKTYVEKMIQMH